MGVRSIQLFALVALAVAASAVAVQTAPSNLATQCRASIAADANALELTAMFTSDAQFENASLFDNAPLLIYAMNEAARESDGITLVDVGDVTNCATRKNII